MGQVLSAWAELEGGDELGLRIESDPDPQIMGLVTEGGVEFIELQMADFQVTEEVRVDLFGVRAGAGEPEAEGGVRVAEEPLDIGYGEAEVDSQEDAAEVSGGGVEAIEGGAPASGEAFFAGLTFELLNAISAAIADEGMEGGIGVTPIITERVGAGMAGGANVFMFTPWAFALWPREDAGLVGVAPERLGVGAPTNGAV